MGEISRGHLIKSKRPLRRSTVVATLDHRGGISAHTNPWSAHKTIGDYAKQHIPTRTITFDDPDLRVTRILKGCTETDQCQPLLALDCTLN